jgi:ribonucleoside-diphosphate reductase alpha chain
LFYTVTKRVTRNLNKVIDKLLSGKEGENSNKRTDQLVLSTRTSRCLSHVLPFTSDEAKKLNQEILKPYFAAVTASMEMAKEEGPYSSFAGLQFLKENFSTIYGN